MDESAAWTDSEFRPQPKTCLSITTSSLDSYPHPGLTARSDVDTDMTTQTVFPVRIGKNIPFDPIQVTLVVAEERLLHLAD